MEFSELAEDSLNAALSLRRDLPAAELLIERDRPRIEWIGRQLANLVTTLRAMIEDLESGLSPSELGFGTPEELAESIEEMDGQIRSMLSMLRSLQVQR